MSAGPKQISGPLSNAGKGHTALLGAVITFVLLLTILWQASLMYQDNLMGEQQNHVETQLVSYGDALDNHVNKEFAHLEGLAFFSKTNPSEKELDKNFEIYASGLYSGASVIRSIEIFPSSTGAYVYPVTGNEIVVGRSLDDLINDENPQVRADVQRAIQSHQTVISDPYEMRRGGLGLVARQAVYQNDSLWGLVEIVLDVPPLLKDAGLNATSGELDMALRDSSGSVFFGSNGTFLMEPAIHYIDLPEGRWELAAVPAEGWTASIEEPLSIFKKGGLAIVLLLTALVYIILSYNVSLKRKVMERTFSLKESENKYRLLSDTAQDFIIVHDLAGRIIYVNKAVVEFSGYSNEELLSKNITEFVPPDQVTKMEERKKTRLMGNRDLYLYETKFADRYGKIISVEVSSSPIEGESIETGVLIVARDVTERKKAEEALVKSEEMFSGVFNTVPDSIILTATNEKIINVNESFSKNKGFEKNEIIGKTTLDVGLWSNPIQREQYISKLKNEGAVRNFEAEITTKSGEHRYALISGDRITTDGETFLLTIFRDITELKDTELALHERERLLNEVGNIANIGGWEVDIPSGKGTWTPEIARIHDVDPQLDPNVEFGLSFYPPDSRVLIEKAFQDAIDKGVPYDLELEFISAKGDHKWVRTGGRPVIADNEVVKMVGYLQDVTGRKEVELALHERERLLNEVGNIAKIGGWEFDVSTGEGTWTPEVALIHDLDPDDETNKDIGLSFYPPGSREIIEQALQNAIEKGDSYDLELELISAKGVHKWVRTNGRPAMKDGKVVKLTGSFQDITERKIAAEKLRESEERFRATFEQAAVGMCQSTLDGVFMQVNQCLCDITGYSSEELLAMNFADITYPEDLEKEKPYVEKILAGEISDYSIEKRYVCKDGRVIWVNVAASIMHSSENEPLYFIGMIEDIDKRKQAEEEVTHYNERLNILHEIDKGIISSVSSEQIANTVLKHLRKLISCSAVRLRLMNEGTNESFVFALDSDYDSQLKIGTSSQLKQSQQLDQLKSGRSLIISDIRLQKGPTSHLADQLAGEGIHSVLVVPLMIDGDLIGILCLSSFTPDFFTEDHLEIVEEVANQLAIAVHHSRLNEQVRQHTTELEERVKERTFQLEAANKELEAFTYSVSHDLRAPLRAIDGFSKIIIEDYENVFDEEGKRLFDIIRTNTQKMDKLITDLLALSRVGRNEMNHATIDMNAMVRSVFNDLIVHEDEKSFVFSVSDLPASCADPTLIKQVWVNLLSNAIKYSKTREEKRIDVGTYIENGMNVYYVRDNGVGYDPKYSHKLFGIFQRLHADKEFEGTGVGLAIVQRIVHRHGGKVWAEGKKNEGATFYFSLPVKEEEHACGE